MHKATSSLSSLNHAETTHGHKNERGLVMIQGDFLTEHKQEIINTIKNIDKKARTRDSKNEVLSIKELKTPKGIMLKAKTNSVNLAEAIGKKLKKSFKGEVDFQWSKENKFVRVYWERWNEENIQ